MSQNDPRIVVIVTAPDSIEVETEISQDNFVTVQAPKGVRVKLIKHDN